MAAGKRRWWKIRDPLEPLEPLDPPAEGEHRVVYSTSRHLDLAQATTTAICSCGWRFESRRAAVAILRGREHQVPPEERGPDFPGWGFSMGLPLSDRQEPLDP